MRLWTTRRLRSLTPASLRPKRVNVKSTRSNPDLSTRIQSATPLLPAHQPPSPFKVSPFHLTSTSPMSSGSALYIFGPTGPSFGTFQIGIDNSVIGTYNASTTINTYGTLLFFMTHLDSSSQHEVVVTNQVDGMMFALDYCVAVQAGGGAGTTVNSSAAPGKTAAPLATSDTVAPFATAASGSALTSPSAVFPTQTSAPSGTIGSNPNGSTASNSSGSAGAVIGGIIGALVGIVSPRSPFLSRSPFARQSA